MPLAGEVTEGTERTLRRILVEAGPLPWQEVVRLGVQVATQLQTFHSRQVCPHGSVCPETIFEAPDRSGYILALPALGAGLPYRAPETHTVHGKRPDARADVFSLGVVLFEALVGDRTYPFRVLRQDRPDVLSDEYSYLPENDLGSLAPAIPPELRRAIERAIRLVPENRFDSPLALAEALQAALTAPPANLRPAPKREPASRQWLPPALWIVAIAAVVAALAVSVVFVVSPRTAPTATDIQRLRKEAQEASAPSLAPQLWLAAEKAAAQRDPQAQRHLYRQARDAAWEKRLAQVNDASRQAVSFEASGEAAFARAHDARLRAVHLWEAHRISDALQSLAEAEEFYRAALHNRRERWVTALRDQLRSEAQRITTGFRPEDTAAAGNLVNEVENILATPEATVDELRIAESRLADLRRLVTVALERAGEQQAARQRAQDSVDRAQVAGRAAEVATQAFPTLESGFARGKEFLDAARQALDSNPVQAVTLADAALQRFRQVESAAERELSGQRQAAALARRQAQDANADEFAADTYAAAEEYWRKAEKKDSDWGQRKKWYQQAKATFERAQDEAEAASRRAALQSRPPGTAPIVPMARPETSGASAPAQAAPKIAAVPSPPAAPPRAVAKEPTFPPVVGPMPFDLATNIQSWLRDTCERLNRTLARSSGGRARCEDLVVHDRRDRARVQVTYSLAYGSLVSEGIRWDAPAQRSATLDCSTGACRCVSGDGC